MDLNSSLTHSTQSPHASTQGVSLAHLSQSRVTENQRQKQMAMEQTYALGAHRHQAGEGHWCPGVRIMGAGSKEGMASSRMWKLSDPQFPVWRYYQG